MNRLFPIEDKKKLYLYPIFFILFSLLIYAPSTMGDPFWDDWVFIFNPYNFKFFSGSPLVFFPGGSEAKAWPIFYTILWSMVRVFKNKYVFYHLTNILVHALNGFLVWKIFDRVKIKNSFLLALLFICHPLQLFTVSWIIQTKTIFSIFFLLLSLWFLIDFRESGKAKNYLLCMGFFVLSIFTKSTTVAFGAALLFSYPLFKEKMSFKKFAMLFIIPFIFASLVATVRTAWRYNVNDYLNRETISTNVEAQIQNSEIVYSKANQENILQPGEVPYFKLALVDRLLLTSKIFARYISFIAIPIGGDSLFQEKSNLTFNSLEFFLIFATVIALILLILFLIRNKFYLELFGFIFFLAALLPFCGIVYVPIFMLSNFVPYWLSIPFLGLLPLIGRFLTSKKLLIGIIATFAFLTHWQDYEFINVQDIFLESIKKSPENRTYQIALIEHYTFTGQCQKAKDLYQSFKENEFTKMYCLDIKTNTCVSPGDVTK